MDTDEQETSLETQPSDVSENATETEHDEKESVSDAVAADESASATTDEQAPAEAELEVSTDETGDHVELVQQLEYVKPAAPEKKSKKRDDDEEESELQLTSVAEARAVLEGYLFTSNEPLSVNRLSKLMNNLHPRTVRGLLLELQMDYDNRAGALQVVEIAGGFQMATRPHLADWMFRMHRHKRRSALSPATLETLAIIAYKQPITKGEVEAIRGVESSGTVRTLQDLNLVEASGRREVLGRPQLFITTEQFLKAFGLKSLADLPSISELRQLFADEQKLQAAVAQPRDEESEAPAENTEAPDTAENTIDEDDPEGSAVGDPLAELPPDVSMSSDDEEPAYDSIENEEASDESKHDSDEVEGEVN